MIALASQLFDPVGSLAINVQIENPFHGQRRGTVTATLDGGSYPYDAGYSISDQTLRATLRNPTREQLVALQYLVSHYSQLVVCTEIGAFLGVVSFSVRNAECSLSIRTLEQLDA